MKPLRILYGVLITASVFSCADKRAGNNGIVFERTEKLVASDSIDIEQYGIYNPQHIVASNDSVWIVLGEGASELVYLLNDSGKYEAKGIRLGKGPNEVLEITSMHRVGHSTFIYDGRKGALSELHYADSTMTLTPRMSGISFWDDACMFPDGKVLAFPVIGNYSYALLDKQGNVTDTLAYYPTKPDGVSDFTHTLACTGTTAFLPHGKGSFARTLVYDGAIDFFKADGDSLKHLARQEEFGMDYDVIDQMGQSVPTLSKTTRNGYRSLTASNNAFYALFSNDLVLKNIEGCSEMQAFAADGTPQCKYQLDRKLSDIAVKPDNSVIYGVANTDDGQTMLYIYHVPKD